jgi:hypothetical protein
MKKIAIILFLLCNKAANTQEIPVKIEANTAIKNFFPNEKCNAFKIDGYKFPVKDEFVSFKADFGSEKLQHSKKWDANDFSKGVYEIDLVFTLYPSTEQLWQSDFFELTKNRIAEMLDIDERFIIDDKIKWNLYLQTAASNKAEAKKMFHGFVVKYRKLNSELSINYYKDRLSKLVSYDTIFTEDAKKLEETFLRNKNKWKKMLIITDCTYSMLPYSTHVVLWHLLTIMPNNTVAYSFFNDGDNKPSSKKRIGSTGGIYVFENPNKKKIINSIRIARIAGASNDDDEENDLEAIIKTMNVAKDYTDIILLADANSPVRDISLLKDIKNPIRIVLCGFNSGTITLPSFWQYYQIANQTGGSLHTVESDIENLAAMSENGKFVIDGIEVQIENGKLKLASK